MLDKILQKNFVNEEFALKHSAIIQMYYSFIARVESIMHKVCLVILMGCTLNMCLLGYYSIMV